MPKIRLLPSESRRRGRPAIGFDLMLPESVEQVDAQGPVEASLVERRPDGRLIGALTIELFAASLVVDRDGVLRSLVATAAERAGGEVQGVYPVAYESGSAGFRADIVHVDRVELPYQSWLALAPADLAVRGGALVTLASLGPDWPATHSILDTLRVFSRDSDARARTEDTGEPLALPFVKR